MVKVDLSEGETALLGLKTGRVNCDNFDANDLYTSILEGRYDICRVKIPAEEEMVSLELHKTGLPFFFSGSIRRYKTPISNPGDGEYMHKDLVFEMYDGSQDELLMEMLVGTWGDYPIGYYRSPYLNTLVDKKMEIVSVFNFYKKQNLNSVHPNNSILFIRHGEKYVGFFALNIVNGTLESHIGGILESYRKDGYFLDKLRYIKEFCINNKLSHFIFGARNENAQVQRIFQYVGFQPIGTENVFHIACLLSYTQKEPVLHTFEGREDSLLSLHSKLAQKAFSIGKELFAAPYRTVFQINYPNFVAVEDLKVSYSFPVITNDEILLVMKSDTPGAELFSGYLRLSK